MTRYVIFGAGAVGCFLGAHWAGAGQSVTLIGRDRTFDGFRHSGLRLSGGADRTQPAEALTLTSDPAALAQADLILLAMKSTALEEAITALAAHAPPDAPLVSLLNGVGPVRRLRAAFPDRTVIAGMVPFNVVWRDPTHLHRSSAGDLAMERHPASAALAAAVAGSGVPITLQEDLAPVQYGKLLLNLANPVNALSGLPLHGMLSQRGYRRIYGDVLKEALEVYRAAGIRWQKVGPISPLLAQRLLRLPDWAFNATLLKLQKIDRSSLTSMASDMAAGRATEIDMLNGEIVALAEGAGVAAPRNRALVDLVKARAGPMGADELGERIGCERGGRTG